MKKPNFFILGAGKCGTTSLYYYLSQHPGIYMSPVKEPVFFNRGFQIVNNPIDYFQLYNGVKNETIVGEASHAYLSNPDVPELLYLLFPEAKFVSIFRNPAERAYSLYWHMRKNNYEKIKSFEKALEKESVRMKSDKFKKNCSEYLYNFMYYTSGLYGEQIRNYLRFYPKHQFYFTTLKELKDNPEQVIKCIFKFLQVEPSFVPDFKLYNPRGRVPKWNFISTRELNRIKKLFPQILSESKLLKRIFLEETPPLKIETKQNLMKNYEKDLLLLKSLTGINLENLKY